MKRSFPPVRWGNLVAVAALSAGLTAVGSIPLPGASNSISGALLPIIVLGALGRSTFRRWDTNCCGREQRPLLGAFTAVLFYALFITAFGATRLTVWAAMLAVGAGVFCCRLLSVIATIGTEMCRTDPGSTAARSVRAHDTDDNKGWLIAQAVVVFCLFFRAAGYLVQLWLKDS